MKLLKEEEKQERQAHIETFNKHLKQVAQATQNNQRPNQGIHNHLNRLQTMISNPNAFLQSMRGQSFFLPDMNNYDDDDDIMSSDYSDDGYPNSNANIEVIDLVSSPVLNIPGVQNLDSEDEHQEKLRKLQSPQLDTSLDSENYEMTIKLKWHGEVQRFKHRKHQKFCDLIQTLADREKVVPQFIVLDMNEKIIRPDDTPDSVGYTVSTFISGRVVKSMGPSVSRPQKRDENLILLKIQSDKWKKPLELNIAKDQKMKVLIIKCSEELKCSAGKLKLFFDGERIDLEDTPEDLDLEGGEMIDCRMA